MYIYIYVYMKSASPWKAGTWWPARHGNLERKTAAREAWGTIGTNISAPGPKAPRACWHAPRFAYILVFLLLVHILSLDLCVSCHPRGPWACRGHILCSSTFRKMFLNVYFLFAASLQLFSQFTRFCQFLLLWDAIYLFS